MSCPACAGQLDANPDVSPAARAAAGALTIGLAALALAAPAAAAALVGTMVVLLVTVTVHEYGHASSARAHGVTVTEYAIGFGPVIASTNRFTTPVTFRLLPVGGFTRVLGAAHGSAWCDTHQHLEHEHTLLVDLPVLAQVKVLTAGVATNVALAWVLIVPAANALVQPHGIGAIILPVLLAAVLALAVPALVVVTTYIAATAIVHGPGDDGGTILTLPDQLHHATTLTDRPAWVGVLLVAAAVNLSVATLNILPLAPLDGYHAALAVIDHRHRTRTGRPLATTTAHRLTLLTLTPLVALLVRLYTHDLAALLRR